jgi:DNA (cytosine-5)-methyltransferase 1
MLTPQFLLNIADELVVDNFAGGGGASTGIERAIGRPVDIAINHDPEAVAMHQANHPQTRHLCESVWDVDPREVCSGRPVGLAWFSPDCKHFSKAKGGKPVEKKIRGLAWVALRWIGALKPTGQHPRLIVLENVEEFVTWGPLTEDGRPCPRNKGREFRAFVNAMQRNGYAVEWRELRACDYGAPTSRKRLFLIARRDGQPITWPAPTHAAKPAKGSGLKPWRTAAECIDWSLPCPSIFERERPLAEATLRRIARGLQRYVIDTGSPFIVKFRGDSVGHAIDTPLPTITAGPKLNPAGAAHALGLCVPTLVQTGYGERTGQAPRALDIEAPLGTVVASQKHALVSAFLAKHYGGVVGQAMEKTLGTVTSVDHHSLVTTNLLKLRGTSTGSAVSEPVPTISAQGTHIAEVRAFLVKFYSSDGQHGQCSQPMPTIPCHDRIGLVTVAGVDYVIADIGMRMLQPRELARAQGFGEGYLLEAPHGGKTLPKHAQVRMVGNSVCPPMAEALVRANYAERQQMREAA